MGHRTSSDFGTKGQCTLSAGSENQSGSSRAAELCRSETRKQGPAIDMADRLSPPKIFYGCFVVPGTRTCLVGAPPFSTNSYASTLRSNGHVLIAGACK